MDEPSVLDYFKAKITPWRGPVPAIPKDPGELSGPQEGEAFRDPSATPAGSGEDFDQLAPSTLQTGSIEISRTVIAWRPLLALLAGLIAERALEPPDRSVQTAVILYTIGALLLLWSNLRGDWPLASLPLLKPKISDGPGGPEPGQRPIQLAWLGLAILFGGIGYWGFGTYKFTTLNLFLWTMSLGSGIMAFWGTRYVSPDWLNVIKAIVRKPQWNLIITPRTIWVVLATLMVIFFRVYRLGRFPRK